MLNKQKGNMYGFITHTWNTLKGKCLHDCSYCYMKRFKNQKEVRFDEKELKTDLGKGNFIFVGSSCDMFAQNIEKELIRKTLNYCEGFDNTYLFQTKNPKRFYDFAYPNKSILCSTIETNRFFTCMGKSSHVGIRANSMKHLMMQGFKTMITIEPILDFDLDLFLKMLKNIYPVQINIGADSGSNNLPEPPKEKIIELINELSKFTKVYQKENLKRLLK